MDPVIFERGDTVYIVAKASPIQPDQHEIEEFAFAHHLREQAPNENIMWLRGQYVEADSPNANGQMWSAGELAIKAMTPNFMPVTVMHDPRTAVGLIADARLMLPEKDSVPRSRIDTSLALWAHRFPDVAEEAVVNHERGDLMQSMECRAPSYECAECGRAFAKVPPFDEAGVGRERREWCAHLNENARRILRNVVFTGTGLIFGTRGARGAYDKAHLEVFQEEVAEYHERAHRGTGKTRKRTRSKGKMEIEDSKYEELVAKANQADRVPDLEEKLQKAEDEKAEAVKTAETAEAAKVKAEEERDEARQKTEKHEEEARKRELASERLGKLGAGFKQRLSKIESVNKRVEEQASTLSDEEWQARLDELAELTGVKPDEGATEGGDGEGGSDEEFSAEEVARSRAAGGTGNGGGPSGPQRKEVVSGLFSQTGKSE